MWEYLGPHDRMVVVCKCHEYLARELGWMLIGYDATLSQPCYFADQGTDGVMFSRRHHIAIAKVLRDTRVEMDSHIGEMIRLWSRGHIIDALVAMFRQDNPGFDEQRFCDACVSEPDAGP